jgi:predicted O-methyltransferase YrrM
MPVLRSVFVALALALSFATPIAAQGSRGEPHLDALLREIKDKDAGQLAVSEEDGQFLRAMIAATKAKRVLEIGGASGYSAIWMGQAVRANGGQMITIEYDPARARELEQNIRRAGLSHVVRVVPGDAFAQSPKLPGTFDFVFLDAWKKDYQRFFDLVFPRLDRGGLFLAHNVVNKASEMGDFLKTIKTNPALWSAIVTPSGEGISISYRRQ